MRLFVSISLAVAGVAIGAAPARAEVKVKLTEMHICCGGCVTSLQKALAGVEGASIDIDKDNAEATISAPNAKVAQAAVSAVAKAGYHGVSDNPMFAMASEAAPKGNVKRLEVSGIHNCCGSCCKSITAAVKGVAGVTACTAKPKVDSFVVEGDFEAAAVVKALNEAGFHAAVK